MSWEEEPLASAMALLERLEPGAPNRVQANLDAFSPEAAELILGYAFSDIVSRDGIDLRTREMLTVAAASKSSSGDRNASPRHRARQLSA